MSILIRTIWRNVMFSIETPTWLAKLLIRAPGTPASHLTLMFMLSFFAFLPDGGNVKIAMVQMPFAAFCVVYVLKEYKLITQQILDARDYVVIRAIGLGVMCSIFLGSALLLFGYLLSGQHVHWLRLFLSGVVVFLIPWRLPTEFHGFVTVAQQLPNWQKVALVNKGRLEDNE
jgi:hypothetical protein